MAQPDFVMPGAAPPPERLGRFLLGRELGRGATGVVYAATDTRQGRQVALKVLTLPPGLSPSQRLDLAERFAREARAVSQLSHPGIVALSEFGRSEDGQQFLVMERLEGETLRARLQRGGPLLASEALPVVTQIADALQYAHGRGIVHRDVKPDNIFVCADGTAKLMDFGVARLYAEDGLTHAGTILGSPAYMSPEQIRGEAPDGRSDVFSLAVTLAQALTGRRPFEGADIPSVMHQILTRPPDLSGVGSRPLRRALEQALAKTPAARTPSAGALAGALRQAASWAPAFAAPGDEEAALTTQVMPRWAVVPPRPSPTARWGAAAGLGALTLIGLAALPLALRHAPRVGAPPRAASLVTAGGRTAQNGRRQAAGAGAAPDGAEVRITETTLRPSQWTPPRADESVLRALRDEAAMPPPPPPPVAEVVPGPERPVRLPVAPVPRATAPSITTGAAPAAVTPAETIPPDAVLYGMGDAGRTQAPHLIRHTDPITPPSAAAGTARLLVSVNPDGGVSDARVVQSSGNEGLDEAAIATVLRWQYAPATHDGRPVSANVAETVTFGPH